MQFLIGLLALFALSCSSAPLSHAHESPDALSRAVLAAIERRDAETLRLLAIDKQEFTEYVWSELPAARSERNLTPSFVWGDLHQKSNLMLHDSITAHGGKKYTLVSTRFLGETTRYESYRVHRESELAVKDVNGAERNLRVFGSVIEKDGRYKVFSYVVND